jgi:hypothetical protein
VEDGVTASILLRCALDGGNCQRGRDGLRGDAEGRRDVSGGFRSDV